MESLDIFWNFLFFVPKNTSLNAMCNCIRKVATYVLGAFTLHMEMTRTIFLDELFRTKTMKRPQNQTRAFSSQPRDTGERMNERKKTPIK